MRINHPPVRWDGTPQTLEIGGSREKGGGRGGGMGSSSRVGLLTIIKRREWELKLVDMCVCVSSSSVGLLTIIKRRE